MSQLMHSPSISIIMPAYNAQQFVLDAVHSIVQQDFSSWELLVIDDASTDNTRDILASVCDPRIMLVELPNNIGNYAARNAGIIKASGKYIAVLDADDVALKYRFRVQYNYMEEHPEVAVIGCGYQTIDSIGNLGGVIRRACSYEELRVKLLADNFMLHSTMFMRRDFIVRHSIHYNETYRYAADYDFVYQCSKYGKVVNTADTLVQYRIHRAGITSTKFIEQQAFASQIRGSIFRYYFGEVLAETDYALLDQLFSQRSQNGLGVSIGGLEELLNRLLHYNEKSRYFSNDLLYKLFQHYALRLIFQSRQNHR